MGVHLTEGEFDAAADGVDAFGHNADAVAQAPSLHARGVRVVCRAGGVLAVRLIRGDDRVIPFTIDAALARLLFEAIDRYKSFDENFHQLDEEAEFLHGNNQRVVFLAQAAFHELSRFPVHQFALGGDGATLRIRAFRGHGVQLRLVIRPLCDGPGGVPANRRMAGRGRIGESPFERAMDD